MRASDGVIITFDALGTRDTQSVGINPAGTIAGIYFDASSVSHGFVRAPNGAITTFDAPGAGTRPGQGTGGLGGAINPAGTIAGNYIDANFECHGFVRATNGAITTFDAPDAGTGLFQGTIPFGSNPAGAIVGYYIDASNVFHGFLVEGE